MLRADWALMNDPERLQALSTQYLTLKPMGPSQLVTLDQLAANLPAPIPPGSKTTAPAPDIAAPIAAPVTDPTHGVPMASNAPARPTKIDGTAVAMLQPTVPAPAATPDPSADTADSGADTPTVTNDATTPVPSASPDAALKAAAAASVAASAAAAEATAHAAPVTMPKVAAVVPHVTHHAAKHVQPAVAHEQIPAQDSLGSLADAGSAGPTPKTAHHAHHSKPAQAPNPGTQYFAANDAPRPAYTPDRITPRAATVMYTPVGGSSLGMASSASMAPPRPLYSSTQ
jgi:hypothetical protein